MVLIPSLEKENPHMGCLYGPLAVDKLWSTLCYLRPMEMKRVVQAETSPSSIDRLFCGH